MSFYPSASALRSATPPLYYHRPEGTTPSYYTIPAREVDGLRIPLPYDSGRGAATLPPSSGAATMPPRASASLYPSVDRNSVPQSAPAGPHVAAAAPPPSPRQSGYAPPFVVNPYAAGDAASASTAGRWSSQQPPPAPQPQHGGAPHYPTTDALTTRVAAIDAEEAAMIAEEATLRAKLTELQLARRRQEEEQLYLSHGWAQMLEKEERYYTEPLVDRRPDIVAREQQCAMLHDHLQQADAHAQHAQAQLQSTEYIIRDVENFEQERKRVQDGFQNIERRRRECVAKAERYFDVETKRVVEGNKVIRKLDAELREMTRRGPLAQLQGQSRSPSQHHSSSSRAVTFATDKSIILDFDRDDSTSGAETAGMESESVGLTNSYANTYASTGGSEEDLGGTSIAFSLNDPKEPLLVKRRKVEVAMV